MSSLADLAKAYGCDLTPGDLDHLHAVLSEWQLLADLSFADLLLFCHTAEAGEFICVGQMRPATGPTCHYDDLVGLTLPQARRWAVDTAWVEGRIVREGDPDWRGGVPVRQEAIPVRHDGRLVAVIARDTNLTAPRVPSALEIAYLQIASELAQMVADGLFPFRESEPALANRPRVGDGLLRIAPDGHVQFASPNGLSAYRRLGYTGNLVGEPLREVHAALELSGRQRDGLDRRLSEGRISRVLESRQPAEAEIEAAAAVVRMRSVPLVTDDRARGALVLVRDVTELRRRELQLMGKDATIREIHHRVKNNLQTVAALLRLQARRTTNEEARLALTESVRRVTSIALVHETLSQTLDEAVDFDGVADDVAGMTVELAATGARPAVRRSGSFGVLGATVATPMALVLSELLQNAVEHAFAGSGGQLEVRAQRGPHRLDMVVADDGAGLPPGFAMESSPRLGLQIVRTLVVGEMRGTFALRQGATGGTEAVVSIPLA